LHPYVRPVDWSTAGRDGFRDLKVQTPQRPLQADGSHGGSRTSERSILPSDLLLQLRLSRLTTSPTGRSLKRRWRMHQTSAQRRTLPRHQQLPGDASGLVGKARPQQAWAACAPAARWLTTTAFLCLLDNGGRSRYQHAAQHLVSGAGNLADPGLARAVE
jgi:hypothetical protein